MTKESLLDRLGERDTWEEFLSRKDSSACPKALIRDLRAFIDREDYLPVVSEIAGKGPFPLPRKAILNKMGSKKRRTVYVYPYAENMVLKLLTHLLLRKYDYLFSNGLYSFRPGRSAKDAIRALRKNPLVRHGYAYKVDISNYFNSIDIARFLPILKAAVADDPELCAFLSALLLEPEVLEKGVPVREEKGIMAGTPLASFYANLYLMDMDARFESLGVPYMRYSDDIIVFGKTAEEAKEYGAMIRGILSEKGLSVNPDKEAYYTPETGFTFLGFYVRGNAVDIAPATVTKLKKKMYRKARALTRWRERNGLPPERAAKAFVRIFNRKLLESPAGHDLTWSYWFFSVINRTESLEEIDHYAEDTLRFLLTGKRTKGRFNARYEDLKALGFRSLKHAYYAFPAEEASPAPSPKGKTP